MRASFCGFAALPIVCGAVLEVCVGVWGCTLQGGDRPQPYVSARDATARHLVAKLASPVEMYGWGCSPDQQCAAAAAESGVMQMHSS